MPTFVEELAGGAAAGLAVDVALFPLDTVKTRAQSAAGFAASGGFRDVYRGLSAALLNSVPSGAAFFAAYCEAKRRLAAATLPAGREIDTAAPMHRVGIHAGAAATAETAACVVRVPLETAKQRMQAGQVASVAAFARSIAAEPWRAYGGFGVTIAREVPFAVTQLCLYERLKAATDGSAAACAGCGFVAGGAAAFITTPIDVAKTRIMLGSSSGAWPAVVAGIARDEGMAALFRGAVPRTTAIAIGGTIFLGTFEAVAHGLARRNAP